MHSFNDLLKALMKECRDRLKMRRRSLRLKAGTVNTSMCVCDPPVAIDMSMHKRTAREMQLLDVFLACRYRHVCV